MATRGLSDPVWYDHGAVLRRIPAGDVHLSALDDRPNHVDAFLLDAAPVTVRRYARFFAMVGRHIAEPLEWARQLLTPDAPVTGVAPDDAAAFAASVGGRLPTLWEWQRVARARTGLASPQHAEPFGVTGLCLRWEWTETPAPSGFWVCGGRYRDRPDERPDADHLAFESGAAVDVGFRVARDLAAAITPSPPPTASGPEPLLLDEPTLVTSVSRREPSSTAPEGEVPASDPTPRPARRFPVNTPRQLAVDAAGNLYLTSSTTVRIVENIDGDDDADGDDSVVTLYGLERETYPENATFCMSGLAIDDDGVVYAADACAGVMVSLTPERL